ncbi:hypothetical protein BDM02DRAFT_1255729 [Thelephora ganbajun]|uniref:Uncharacterized protein n=1 Tax=Thelephora ganbajun TaxID=370292 RepID=A0ACB6ZMK1_THEGA|nr:hypothetical protein BDM02DRAFT_1255729 [Thelephora ganbajun]
MGRGKSDPENTRTPWPFLRVVWGDKRTQIPYGYKCENGSTRLPQPLLSHSATFPCVKMDYKAIITFRVHLRSGEDVVFIYDFREEAPVSSTIGSLKSLLFKHWCSPFSDYSKSVKLYLEIEGQPRSDTDALSQVVPEGGELTVRVEVWLTNGPGGTVDRVKGLKDDDPLYGNPFYGALCLRVKKLNSWDDNDVGYNNRRPQDAIAEELPLRSSLGLKPFLKVEGGAN